MFQRPRQRGLHFHLAELFYGEAQVLQGFFLFVRVML
jgi:hypothetical protein